MSGAGRVERSHALFVTKRALIVGAGGSGFLHALALRSAGIAIAGVYDPSRAEADLLASLVGGDPTSSFEVARRMHVDIVAVCSPPIFHVDQAEALAHPARLLFVEKPVALDDDELGRLRRLPNVVPVLQWRAGRAAHELRVLFQADAFGPRPHVTIDVRAWRDDAYYASGRRGAAQWGCGVLTSIGIHAVDLLLHAVGRPVVASSGREWIGRTDVDVATAGEMRFVFEDGVTADLRISLDERGSNEVRVLVRGERGSAELVAEEADPTGAALSLRGAPRRVMDAAGAVGGACGSPLLVPFVRAALDAHASGGLSVSVADVADAHQHVFQAGLTSKNPPRSIGRVQSRTTDDRQTLGYLGAPGTARAQSAPCATTTSSSIMTPKGGVCATPVRRW